MNWVLHQIADPTKFWSYRDGWVARESATVYSDKEKAALGLPFPSVWAPASEHDALSIIKWALLDMQGMLQEGFDTNLKDVKRQSWRETIDAMIAYVRTHDPAWPVPEYDTDESEVNE